MRMPVLALLAAVLVLAPTLAQERTIRQWVSNVTDVTPHDTPSFIWGFFTGRQIIGPNNVYPNYGYLAGAWSFNTSFLTTITLSFEHAVKISAVEIFETYNGGSVVTIAIKNPATGEYDDILTREPTVEISARNFKTDLKEIDIKDYETDSILLIMNCTMPICQIDAVAITGTIQTEKMLKDGLLSQYAEDVVEESSEVDTSDGAFTARNVLGAPNVWPKHRDMAGNWDQWTQTPYSTFIAVSFVYKMKVKSVEVFEPWLAGGVYQISLKDPASQWRAVWSGKAKYPRDVMKANVFKPQLNVTDFYTNEVRIDINSQGYKTRSIDAIRLTGEPCFTDWKVHPDTTMIGHEVVTSITTVDDCKKHCIDQGSCVGIDWNKDQGLCYINPEDAETITEGEYDHYTLVRCDKEDQPQ